MSPIDQLRQTVAELSVAYHDLKFAKSEELRQQRDVWVRSEGNSQSLREKEVKYRTVDYTIAVWEEEFRIKALTDQKYLLLELIHASAG